MAIGEDRYDSVRDEHDLLVGGTIAARHGEIVKLLAHELIGKLCLGIDPDDPQRWG